MAVRLTADVLGLHDENEVTIDVLDLPQLYTRPSAPVLISVLDELKSEPPSWNSSPRSGNSRSISGVNTPNSLRRKVKNEGVPGYLTNIISSPLKWIEDDEQKEQIWETAAQELSARSGRTAMGDMTRSFLIPLSASTTLPTVNGSLTTAQALAIDTEDMVEISTYEPALTADNLGLKTWASSFLLAKRLCQLRTSLPHQANGCEVLELGAGTGLVGIAAACVFRRPVLLTDLPDIVVNLEQNACANASVVKAHGGSVRSAVLDWSEPQLLKGVDSGQPAQHSFGLILAADVAYSAEQPRLLAHAIDFHLGKGPDARVIIELPMREAFTSERDELHQRLVEIGLIIYEAGIDVGFDDWSTGHDDEPVEVHCQWSIWGWKP